MQTTNLFSIILTIALAAGLSACDKEGADDGQAAGGAEQTTPTQMAPGQGPMMGQGQFRQACPIAVEGTDVEVEDTENGVALTFTTESGDVELVRERAEHLAAMYEMHRGRGHMMWHHMGRGGGHMGRGMGPGAGQGPMPAANATVEEIEGGARLVLTPVGGEDLATLRQHARFHQQRMHAGQCWRLQDQEAEG